MTLPMNSDLQDMFSSFCGRGEFLVESRGGTEFLSELTPELRDYKIGLRPWN